MSACPRCGQVVVAKQGSPGVASSSLGAGTYHETCAREAWEEKRRAENDRRESTRVRRADHARRAFRGSAPLATTGEAPERPKDEE